MSLTYPAGTRAEGVAEAFVPGISILPAVGGSMPSMGEVLKRYPDSETENGDGSVTEIFTQITDEEFNAFVADLEEQGARTADLRTDGRKAAVKVPAKNDMIAVSYDSGSGEAKVTYPAGTYDERMRTAKAHFEEAEKFLAEEKVCESTGGDPEDSAIQKIRSGGGTSGRR